MRWLLEKKCREQGIDIQLIDSHLTYRENVANIEQQTHKKLFKPKVKRERQRKEQIKDLGDSLRDMGYVSNLDEEMKRLEEKSKVMSNYG